MWTRTSLSVLTLLAGCGEDRPAVLPADVAAGGDVAETPEVAADATPGPPITCQGAERYRFLAAGKHSIALTEEVQIGSFDEASLCIDGLPRPEPACHHLENKAFPAGGWFVDVGPHNQLVVYTKGGTAGLPQNDCAFSNHERSFAKYSAGTFVATFLVKRL